MRCRETGNCRCPFTPFTATHRLSGKLCRKIRYFLNNQYFKLEKILNKVYISRRAHGVFAAAGGGAIERIAMIRLVMVLIFTGVFAPRLLAVRQYGAEGSSSGFPSAREAAAAPAPSADILSPDRLDEGGKS